MYLPLNYNLKKTIATGPKTFSKQTLIKNKYPTVPLREYYLVYKVERVHDMGFENRDWDITKLNDYQTSRGSGLPFATTLTELMNAIVKV